MKVLADSVSDENSGSLTVCLLLGPHLALTWQEGQGYSLV